jgi:hypothetical protein
MRMYAYYNIIIIYTGKMYINKCLNLKCYNICPIVLEKKRMYTHSIFYFDITIILVG